LSSHVFRNRLYATVPELPDITIYIEALEARSRGATLDRVRLASPFVLRSFDPSISEANGRVVTRKGNINDLRRRAPSSWPASP